MDNRPIGVFDSGLGGLTAVKELLHIMPHEEIIYFGDTGRVPYGTRGKEIIIKYAQQDIAFLKSKNVKMIIAACGTVSSVASNIGSSLDIPYTGVVKPTAKAAVAATRSGRIGVIGTTATIRSSSYSQELLKIQSDLQVFEHDCPLFVPLVENGFIDENDAIPYLVAEKYLAPFKEEKVDTLILGCTHYPLLRGIIAKIMGPDVFLIDSGSEAAAFAAQILEENGLLSESSQESKFSFFVSDHIEGFQKTAKIFLEYDVEDKVHYVDIETY